MIKSFLPKSLLGRSVLILLTPLVCVQMILGYIFFDRHTETILKTLSQTIAGDIALVMMLIEENQTPIKKIQKLSKNYLSVDLSFKPNEILYKTGQYRDHWLYKPLIHALNEKITYPYYVRMTSDFIYISVECPKKGVVDISFSRKRLFSRTTPLVLIWTTVSAILLFVVSLLFMRNQIRPIRRLAEASDKFGRGDEVINFKPEGATEVKKAGYAFLKMRTRLQRLIHDRLEMLAGVSHDLRTPITRIKLAIALMPENNYKTQIKRDVEMLHDMLEAFLAYAKGTYEEKLQEVNLKEFIEKILTQIDFPYKMEGEKDIFLSIKKLLFNRCLTNLIVNCKKHAKQLIVRLYRSENHVVIVLDDDGNGIPVHERDNVFKPFYRIDHARNLDKGGFGLGLSIAKDIVNMHGGQMTLLDSPIGGLRVKIRLPV